MRKYLLGLGFFWLITGAGWAKTIRVPQDYATLTAAMSAAEDNDEIVVSPGNYVGCQVDKNVTIRSTFDGKDWSIIENTRVNGFYIIIGTTGVVIRGFRVGPDPITIPPGVDVNALVIISSASNATVEYCIIENGYNINYHSGFPTSGAALKGVKGVIRNNIIRNNIADVGSAMYECSGLIQNNLIYNTNGYDLGFDFVGDVKFINNTVYSSTTAGIGARITFINNILWQGAGGVPNCGSAYPRNSVIKGYTGPGTGIITSDPKFVDPSKADFHLQTTSPCIDAGLTTGSIKADIMGVQRGLKGVSETRGDGSGMDIGAYEYKPKPVSVWLPNGGPDTINAGDTLTVAWELDVPPAGTAINLQLFNGSARVADFGFFWNANGAAESTIILPTNIPTRTTYTLRGISAWNPSLYFTAPLMTIFGKNAIPARIWNEYL